MLEKLLELVCISLVLIGIITLLLLPFDYYTTPLLVIIGLGAMFWLSPLLTYKMQLPIRLIDGYSFTNDDPRTRISRIFNLCVWSCVLIGVSILWTLVMFDEVEAGINEFPSLILGMIGTLTLCVRLVVLYYEYFKQTSLHYQ